MVMALRRKGGCQKGERAPGNRLVTVPRARSIWRRFDAVVHPVCRVPEVSVIQ